MNLVFYKIIKYSKSFPLCNICKRYLRELWIVLRLLSFPVKIEWAEPSEMSQKSSQNAMQKNTSFENESFLKKFLSEKNYFSFSSTCICSQHLSYIKLLEREKSETEKNELRTFINFDTVYGCSSRTDRIHEMLAWYFCIHIHHHFLFNRFSYDEFFSTPIFHIHRCTKMKRKTCALLM